MTQERLYSPDDLRNKRITFLMACRTCDGRSEIQSGLWSMRLDMKGNMSLEEFNDLTGANLETEPDQWIKCPDCENGLVEAWAYMSDLSRVTSHQVNRFTDYIAEEIKKVNEACQTSSSDLQVELSAEITNELSDLRQELISNITIQVGDLHDALSSRINEQRDNINQLCGVISDLRKEIEDFQKSAIEIDQANANGSAIWYSRLQKQINDLRQGEIMDLQKQIILLRQEIEQDNVLERVFGDKGES